MCLVVFKILFCSLARKNVSHDHITSSYHSFSNDLIYLGWQRRSTCTDKRKSSVQSIFVMATSCKFIIVLSAHADNDSLHFFISTQMCDLVATSTMYIGLNLTYASSFQMLRGSVIIFVALFSKIFLGRVMGLRRWSGIFFIATGLTIVGLSDMLSANSSDVDKSGILIGDTLIVLAQIITATQMVYEERFVGKLDIPSLQAVGWEGTFGFVVLSILLIPMYFIHVPSRFSNNPRGVMEDVIDAFVMIKNNHLLLVPLTGTVISIAFFNFAGISVTKEVFSIDFSL